MPYPRGRPRLDYPRDRKPAAPRPPRSDLEPRICRNLKCNKVFTPNRDNMLHCCEKCGHDARRAFANAVLNYLEKHTPKALAKIEENLRSRAEGLRAAPPRHDPQEELPDANTPR